MKEQGSETMARGQVYLDDILKMKEDESSEYENSKSEIAEFYDGLNILVTGGSGFLGKVLIEKLLRSCPKIGKVYLLMRPKKGKNSQERFDEQFEDAIYYRLWEERPNFKSHVVMIEGDTGVSDLGLSLEDRQKLQDNIHIIFHGAATVRFDESLCKIININVRGTKLLLRFAREMKNLKAFVHISTAFSNCISENIEEKFYDPPMDPDKVLSMVDIFNDEQLEYLTPKILGTFPNTYAFSKIVSEDLVRQYSVGLPTCVVRPSIMISTYREPIRGWINNFYGPTGVVVGSGIGLLRSLHCEEKNIADMIPADYVINNIVVAGWDTANTWEKKQQENKEKENDEPEKIEEPIIYNSVSSCQKPIDWGTFMRYNEIHGVRVPSNKVLWHYWLTLNRHLWVHNLYCMLFHFIPGAMVDFLALMTGRKPMLLKAYKKIHKFSSVISYFCTRQWKFDNKNVLKLWEKISDIDRKKFYFNVESLDWNEYYFYHVRGIRVFILKDPLHTIPQGQVVYNRLRYTHYALVTAICLLIAWLLYSFMKFVFI